MSRSRASAVRSIVPTLGEIEELLPDWRVHLRSRNVAPNTIKTYLRSARKLASYLSEHDEPSEVTSITKQMLEGFFADLVTGGAAASSVAKHYRQLQQFFRWLAEDDLPRSPMVGMKPPAVPEQPVAILSVDDIGKLLDACKGTTFEQRRDYAILRFFLDTGVRLNELATIAADGIDWEQEVAHVLGKGRRGRAVPFGSKTSEALRKYLRVRSRHPHAKLPYLWLGRKGRLTDDGVRQMLERRVADAGLPHIHPHQFRHTFAHLWLASGGREQDLMRLAGWRSRQMLGRYGASAADARAVEAHRSMGLGDLF